MTATVIVGALAAAGIAAYVYSAWRYDRRCDAAAWDDVADIAAVAEAERIVRHAYTTDPSTWPR